MGKFFDTDRKIRLGIWGLGRGGTFMNAANALNYEIVAGCDYNPIIRDRFKEKCPDAFITDDEEEFLNTPMDAVLIATFFISHAEHTIRALEKGLHVMCEVTSFFTPAEGVKLVEAVERSGKVYNLLENYPFTKENMYLAKLYREGFFGEFQYAEFEYLHDCRDLSYCYNALGWPPVEPGYTAHSWRSILDFHYYNTHSLGPVMQITGLRPVSITGAMPEPSLAGALPETNWGKPCPSMIKMSNGGVMRNLCGSSAGNYHNGKRFWGTRASAESLLHDLTLCLGAHGSGPRFHVTPEWESMGEEAEKNGHGGGDFWELYYFAREILYGTPSPWDVYAACDVTLAGIMAVKSHEAGGEVMEIPDFRDKAIREKYRNDHFKMSCPVDPQHIFPEGHDPAISSKFTGIMRKLFPAVTAIRTAIDGEKIYPFINNEANKLALLKVFPIAVKQLDAVEEVYGDAQAILAHYPDSPAGKALASLLGDIDGELTDGFAALKARLEKIQSDCLAK